MKTVLITGANRGLGLEFAKQYLEQGNRVIATARDLEKAKELQGLARQFPETLTLHVLDVTDAASRKQLARDLDNQPIHLLINNAGVSGGWGSFGKLDEAAWLQVLHANAIAPIKMVEALRANLANAEAATVAILSSKMGSMADNTSGGSYIYRSSKAALNAAAKSLAIDLAGENIKVAILHPGWVRTDMGGPNGLIDAPASVSGLRRVIAGLTKNQCGQFIAYDGTVIPW
ncbi:MAG TPA: SDR family oxidoreductase [Dongiaceae bacterium]|nr:SDR family oxidoreductase [Dongiaceae bacterium]